MTCVYATGIHHVVHRVVRAVVVLLVVLSGWMLMPAAPVLFTEAEAMKFEALHMALENANGNISEAILELRKNREKHISGMPWGYPYIESIMSSPAYTEWRTVMQKILLNHAQHSALVRVANTRDLNDQARAQVAVAMLKGEPDKASRAAMRGKRKQPVPNIDPAENPANHSETADLLSADEDEN